MKNILQDGDFRVGAGANFTPASQDPIGPFWSSNAIQTVGPDTRGEYIGTVFPATEEYTQNLVDPSSQNIVRVSLTEPDRTVHDDFYAVISNRIANANRNVTGLDTGSFLRVSFWVYSTSRHIGLRLRRNYGTESSSPEEVYDKLFTFDPVTWRRLSYDFPLSEIVPKSDFSLATDDYIQLDFVVDSVRANGAAFSSPVLLLETSASPGNFYTCVTAVCVEVLSKEDLYSNAPVSDVCQLTDKKSLLGGSAPADGSITTAKLADQAVTTDKLASQSVTSDILDLTTVKGAILSPGSVDETIMAPSLFTGTLSLADGTNVNFVNGVVTSASGPSIS